MGEQGVLGTRGSCGSKKRWFCGRKRAELLAVAGGLDVRFGREEWKADGRGSCTREKDFD